MHTEKIYKLPKDKKQEIMGIIKDALLKHDEVSFAYIHGSFVMEDSFRDIDVAVFLRKLPESVLGYELQLETELNNLVHIYPVDVRTLNKSPLSFRYNVIKNGMILFAINDDERANFQEVTISRYFDFSHYRNMYLKETLGIGV